MSFGNFAESIMLASKLLSPWGITILKSLLRFPVSTYLSQDSQQQCFTNINWPFFSPLVTITEAHALQKQLFGKKCLEAEFPPCGHPASSNNPPQTTVPAKPQTHNPSGDVEYAQQVHWFWSSMHFQHSVKANLPNCMPASRRLGLDILGLALGARPTVHRAGLKVSVEDEPSCSAVLSYES